MKFTKTKKSFVLAALSAASLISSNAMAGSSNAGDWISQSGDFVTLDSAKNEAKLFVVYPKLGGGNCGVGLALNFTNSHKKHYQTLIDQVTVASGADPLALVSVSNSGALFAFGENESFYGAYVTITANYGQTFGDIFGAMPVYDEISVLASAVSCGQLMDAPGGT
jgi:hypothetical protein